MKIFLKATLFTALAFSASLALAPAAQAATVTLFPVAATNAGTPRISAALNYGGRATSVKLQVVSSTWATDNPVITVTLAVQQSFDNGTNWQDMCVSSFHPRTFSRTGALPAMNCWAGDDLGARKVRATLAVDTSSLTLGIDATT